jgi:hypothetical protein
MDIFRFGMILGSVWAVTVFFIGLMAARFEKLKRFISVSSRMYFGFRPGLPGALVGAFWGFCDGFLSGAIIAMLYNLFHK